MPLYDFECTKCGSRYEVFRKMDEPKEVKCMACGNGCSQIIVLGHGGYLRPDSSWYRETGQVLSDSDDGKPAFENRDGMLKFFKEHPNLKMKDSHPAIPSSMAPTPKAPKVPADKRRRELITKSKAHLQKMNAGGELNL